MDRTYKAVNCEWNSAPPTELTIGTHHWNSPIWRPKPSLFIFSAVECIFSSLYDSPCLTLGFYSAVAIAKRPSLVSSTRRFGRFVPVPPYFSHR